MSNPSRVRSRKVGSTLVVDLEGDLSHESEAPLHTALQAPQMTTQQVVLMNFARVDYINSAGISLLVSLVSEMRQGKRSMMACCLSSHYQKIFRMVGLGTFIRIFDSEGEALAAAHNVRPTPSS